MIGRVNRVHHNRESTRPTSRACTVKIIKNAPSALLSYISTRQLLHVRTQEKCQEKREPKESASGTSRILNNIRGTSFFISSIKCPGDLSELSYRKSVDEICRHFNLLCSK